jgi:hypothetical protein
MWWRIELMSIVGFEVPPDFKEALDSAARKDDRSISSYVRRAVRDRLEQDGMLPRAPSTRRDPTGGISGAAA